MMTATREAVPDSWWTAAQAADAMISIAIDAAATWAERAFLTACELAPPEPNAMTQQWADLLAASIMADMAAENGRIAADLGLTAAQHQQLDEGRATVFGRRLAELAAFAGHHRGRA